LITPSTSSGFLLRNQNTGVGALSRASSQIQNLGLPMIAELAQEQRKKKEQQGLFNSSNNINERKKNGVARRAGISKTALFGETNG
jgi:hypothetical protein